MIEARLLIADQLTVIEDRHRERTQGPYYWDVNTATKSVRLISRAKMRPYVLAFCRWGLQSAAPLFRNREHDVLERVEQFAKPRVAHHPNFNMEIDHPDARGLAYSWQDVDDLLVHVAALEQEIADLRRALGPHSKGAVAG